MGRLVRDFSAALSLNPASFRYGRPHIPPQPLNAATFVTPSPCHRVDTSAPQQDNARATGRNLPISGLCPINPRHMDVYPSRNVDIREHRVPALHYKLICCGDRLRSAGAFLD